MPRWFNTAGPNNPANHYTLPMLDRLPGLGRLIETESWFVLHAPRQCGKTTAMAALAEKLTATGRYAAILATCEAGATYADQPEEAARAIISDIRANALELREALQPPPSDERKVSTRARPLYTVSSERPRR